MSRRLRDPERQKRGHISKIVSFANLCIWVVCGLIALVFSALTLKDIPFGPALSHANPQYFQAIVLSIYISCWAIGTGTDTRFQSSVYLVDPLGGRIRLGSILAVAGLAIISIILLLVRKDELYFALALAVFTTIDISTWLYLRYWFLPPIIQATQKEYELQSDFYGLVLLKTVLSQVIGNWKWSRQVFMSAIIIAMIVLAISPNAKNAAAEWFAGLVPGASPEAMNPLVQDFLLLLFLIVSEVWHFAIRLRTVLMFNVINGLESDYLIRPRAK